MLSTIRSSFRFFALLASIWTIAGCDKKDIEQVSVDGPPPSSWMLISDDSVDLTFAMELAANPTYTPGAQRDEFLDDLMTPFSERKPLSPEDRKRLLNAVNVDQATPESVAAAVALCKYMMVEGRDHLTQTLIGGTDQQKIEVLKSIDGNFTFDDTGREKYVKFLLGDQELAIALRQSILAEASSVSAAAVQSCGKLKIPGLRDQLLERLEQDAPSGKTRSRVYYWLSECEPTMNVFNRAVQHTSIDDLKEHWTTHFFDAYVTSEDDALSRQACDWLKQTLPKDDFVYRHDYVDAIAETSVRDDIPWLKSELERDPCRSVIAALIRLGEDSGRQQILRWLDDPETHNYGIWAARDSYGSDADDEVVARLQGIVSVVDDSNAYVLCLTLVELGGDPVWPTVEPLLQNLDSDDAEAVRQSRHRVEFSLDELAAGIEVSGLLSAERVARARKQLEEDMAIQLENGWGPQLSDLLIYADLALSFDVETGELPCCHDSLVSRFAETSSEIFVPEAISQEWHQGDPDDYEADYTLRFIHNGRLYRGRIRNFGDWYDVERVVTLVNSALQDAGAKERFVPLAPDGQIATFVFADPERLRPLAEKFRMKLSDNPNEAMSAGQAFEQRFLDEL